MAEFTKPTINTEGVLRAQTEGTGRVVTDRSAEIRAKAINQAIGAGMEVAEAKVTADFEKELEGGLDEFYTAKLGTTPELLAEEMDRASTNYADALTDGDAPAVVAANKEFQRIDRLRRLGSITAGEAKLQAEVMARRHIKENPFWRKEIAESYSTTMGLHDQELKYIGLEDQQENGMQEWLWKQMAQEAIALGIPVQGKSIEQLTIEVAPIKSTIAAYDSAKRQAFEGEQVALDNLYGTDFNGGALQGGYSKFQLEMSGLIDRLSSGELNIDEFESTANALQQTYANHFLVTGPWGRWIPQEHKTRISETFSSAAENAVDAYKNDKSAAYIKNLLDIRKNDLQYRALGNQAFAARYVASELAPEFAGDMALYKNDSEMMRRMTNYIIELGAGNTDQPPYTAIGKRIVSDTGTIVNDAITHDKPQTQEQWDEVSQTVENMANILSKRSYTPEEMRNVLTIGGNPKIAPHFANNPAFKSTAETMRTATADALDSVILPNLTAKLNETLSNTIIPPYAARGGTSPMFKDAVTLNVSEQGTVSFQLAEEVTDSPQERSIVLNKLSALNKTYSVDLNNAIKTIAHVNGNTDYLSAAVSILGRIPAQQLPELAGAVVRTQPRPSTIPTENLTIEAR